jgi:hypothetical protein
MLEAEWGYKCSRCSQYLPFNHFHTDNSKPPFYIAYTCKQCRKDASQRKPQYSTDEEKIGLQVLTSLGYDIEGDVHQQFLDKIKLKYGKQIG